MFKRVLFLIVAFGLLFGAFLLLFPVGSYFPALFFGSAKDVLILYDEPSGGSLESDQVDAMQLRQLLGHFNVEVEVVSAGSYPKNSIRNYDRIFYVGIKAFQPLPTYLLDDLAASDAKIFWINANLWQYTDNYDTSHLGFRLQDNESTHATNSVKYKDRVLWKKDDATYRVVVDEPRNAKVWAEARTAGGSIPWIVQSGDFWYAASNPFSYAVEGSCYLAFCDILHEFLGQDHASQKRAMVRIEDVHAMRDPHRLRAVADYLYSEGIPFGFTLVPVYRASADSPPVYLFDRPEFLDAVRYMVQKGGIPVLHGYTHQQFGETAVDYEFWEASGEGPRSDDSRSLVAQRIEAALNECFQNDIYPLAWTTPHYAASQLDYSIIADFFTTAWERRQPVDLLGSDQFFPYLIKKDMHDQILIPESLGYLTAGGERSPAALIQDAANTLVVRDGYASFFYHSFLPLERLQKTVAGIRSLGYEFVGLTEFNNIVNTGNRAVMSGTVEASLTLNREHLHEFTIDEDGNKSNETYSVREMNGPLRKYISMKAGRRKILEGVPSAPPVTLSNIGRFRPTVSGVTNPVALFLLFVGLAILLLFLIIWIMVLAGRTLDAARDREREGR